MPLLQQSTPVNVGCSIPGYVAGAPAVKISKDGGGFVAPSAGTVIVDLNDYVCITLDATDTDTVGDLSLQVTGTGGFIFYPEPHRVATMPLALLANDGTADLALKTLSVINSAGDAVTISAAGSATGLKIDGDSTGIAVASSAGIAIDVIGSAGNYAVQIGADAGVFINGAAGPGITVGAAGGNGVEVSSTGANGLVFAGVNGASFSGSSRGMTISATTDEGITVSGGTYGFKLDGDNILTKIANALLDLVNGVETGLTVRQFFRLAGAALYGRSFLTGSTRRFRNPGDTTDRITATTDTQGQRTAVTLNP